MRSGDAGTVPSQFHCRMRRRAARHTVALAVVPRLLSDTLRLALMRSGYEVVGVDEPAAEVAVLSASVTGPTAARVVVRLPAGSDGRVGTVVVDGRRHEVVLDSLAAVLAVVRAHG